MPELPEVETVVRTLEHLISQRQIKNIQLLYTKMIHHDLEDFKTRLTGQHFLSFERRGKYLLFETEDEILVVHLRMEGKFYVFTPTDQKDKHVHVIFDLDDGRQLCYHDVRKFGTMELVKKGTDFSHWHNLGPEPFSPEFNVAYCKAYLKKRKTAIKTCLLDQSFVAGVGNIYANEICYAIQVDPRRLSNTLTLAQMQRLIDETRRILTQAIEAGGSTIRSYTSSLGVTGLFQLQIKVHGQQDQPCPSCQCCIKKIVVGGRGTYYCPTCQKRRGS